LGRPIGREAYDELLFEVDVVIDPELARQIDRNLTIVKWECIFNSIFGGSLLVYGTYTLVKEWWDDTGRTIYRRFRCWFLRVFFGVHVCVKPTGTVSMLNTSSGIHPRFSMNYKRDNGF